MAAILNVFEYQMTTDLFEYASFAILIAYTGIALWMTWNAPTRLPVSIVRRAL